MSKKYACVLDFGSSKISVMIGERGVNNTFNIKGTGETEYAGFYEGEFVEPENLESAIRDAIVRAETNSGISIKKIYVGVPSEFSYCECAEGGVNFGKRIKIKKEQIYSFFDMASENVKLDNNLIINRSPIYFVLDDNKKCMNPENEYTTKLSGKVSFVLADKDFVARIDRILSLLNIEQVEYISSVLSESIYLLEPEIRDSGAILIDCGYISSFITTIKGDGLTSLNAFSVGGGHITGDLCQILKIGFGQAGTLKRKVVLSLDVTDSDFYEINSNNAMVPVSAKLANEIVEARLDMIASLINRCLAKIKDETDSYMPIYLTGGGICYLKGAKDYLSKSIARNIEVVSPNVPQLNRPHFSSVLGLLDIALNQEEQKKVKFKDRFKKLFNK